RRRDGRPLRPRPRDPAAALRAGHDADRDLADHRRVADAGLAPDPPVAGAAADGHRVLRLAAAALVGGVAPPRRSRVAHSRAWTSHRAAAPTSRPACTRPI